jgi:hypothetical protein
MPHIAATATINLPYKTKQQDVKKQAHDLFSANFPQTDRLILITQRSSPVIFVSPYPTTPNLILLRNGIMIIGKSPSNIL